jgi:hypothetical protein
MCDLPSLLYLHNVFCPVHRIFSIFRGTVSRKLISTTMSSVRAMLFANIWGFDKLPHQVCPRLLRRYSSPTNSFNPEIRCHILIRGMRCTLSRSVVSYEPISTPGGAVVSGQRSSHCGNGSRLFRIPRGQDVGLPNLLGGVARRKECVGAKNA